MVFYLQRVEPPVLPCLQALRGGEWTDAWPCDADSLPSLELLQLIDPDQPAQLRVRVRVRVRVRLTLTLILTLTLTLTSTLTLTHPKPNPAHRSWRRCSRARPAVGGK